MEEKQLFSFEGFDINYLEHHGIKGQKWGERRYQNSDGSLTQAGKIRYLVSGNPNGQGGSAGSLEDFDEENGYKISPAERLARAEKLLKSSMNALADYRSKSYNDLGRKLGWEGAVNGFKEAVEDYRRLCNLSSKDPANEDIIRQLQEGAERLRKEEANLNKYNKQNTSITANIKDRYNAGYRSKNMFSKLWNIGAKEISNTANSAASKFISLFKK